MRAVDHQAIAYARENGCGGRCPVMVIPLGLNAFRAVMVVFWMPCALVLLTPSTQATTPPVTFKFDMLVDSVCVHTASN